MHHDQHTLPQQPQRRHTFQARFIAFCLFFSLSFSVVAETTPVDWQNWLAQFRVEALADGIQEKVFDLAFANVTPNQQVVHFDRNQPEKRITYLQYRQSRIDPYRIKTGRRKYQQYQPLLRSIANEYGVNPCVIIALWGLESSYGSFKGKFPVINSLATLAFDGRRSAFFRNELLLALHILQEGHVSLTEFKGEWAGASGHPQFLPSSWRKFAVDHDGDGRKDIWNSLEDVFGSIANYLSANGWEKNQPWAIQVSAPISLPRDAESGEQPLWKWLQMGVQLQPTQLAQKLDPQLNAQLIEPFGGPTLLVFNNFQVFKRYNNSNFYAGSVGYLADEICQMQ